MTDIQPEQEAIDKQLTLSFAHLMIGKEYPNVGQLVKAALPIIEADRQAQRSRICGEILEYIGMHEADTSAGQRIKAKVEEVEHDK